MDFSELFPTKWVSSLFDKAGGPSPREYDYTGRSKVASGGAPRLGGVADVTPTLTVNSSALALKIALEELVNVEAVDVSKHVIPAGNDEAGATTFMVTFTHDLGDIPLLQYEEGDLDNLMSITEVQEGVTEVQTITTDADVGAIDEGSPRRAWCLVTVHVICAASRAAIIAIAVRGDGGRPPCFASDAARYANTMVAPPAVSGGDGSLPEHSGRSGRRNRKQRRKTSRA